MFQIQISVRMSVNLTHVLWLSSATYNNYRYSSLKYVDHIDINDNNEDLHSVAKGWNICQRAVILTEAFRA
jgi:hypothetical protein